MILENVGMLICDSPRSRAYLQIMAKNDYMPKVALIMRKKEDAPKRFNLSSNDEKETLFDLNETLTETLNKIKVPYEFCNTKDPNDGRVVEKLKSKKEKYFIYSGPGGVVLRKEILNTKKRFIHVHSGWIPEYKGSTTIYYSILKEGRCGVSAFFMDEKLDSGTVIKRRWFEKPGAGVNTDYYYDSLIRAALLKDILGEYSMSGKFPEEKLDTEKYGETYFIIHPVLKNISILECRLKA